MSHAATAYKHSGAIGPAGFIVPVFGIIITILFSYAYAYASVYSPIGGVITVILLIVFAVGTGFFLSVVGYAAKCRNAWFMHAMGFLTSIFALYTSWVVFVFVLMRQNGDFEQVGIQELFFAPDSLWELMQSINSTGWYSIRDATPSGTFLWIIWGIEALVIIVAITYLASASLDSAIFCEDCSQWSKTLSSFHLAPTDDISFLEKLMAGETEILAELDANHETLFPRITVDLYSCGGCTETNGYKLRVVTLEVDKDGKTNEDSEDLTGLFLLPSNHFKKLKELGDRPAPEPDAESEVGPEDEGDAGM